MVEGKRKIFVLVEGEKLDVALMERLLSIYQIDAKYEIVSYRTNIYTLYQEMFEHGDPDDIDLLQMLKSREPLDEKKALFDDAYTDILLVFDLDPHDGGFTPDKIQRMASYFVESSDMGKLYLNYPMVEAFFHMRSIPDDDFTSRFTTLDELLAGQYKERVNRENRNRDYRKFAATREDCSIVIKQNMQKALFLISHETDQELPPAQIDILSAELNLIRKERKVAVLNTCAFFIPEYNQGLLKDI